MAQNPEPATVCEEYAGLIRWHARRYFRRYFRRYVGWSVDNPAGRAVLDELEQAVRIGFWTAARKYQPGRGSFTGYAELCSRRVVSAEFRQFVGRGMVKPRADSRTLLAAPKTVAPPRWFEVQAPEELPDDGAFWERLRAALSDKEYAVAEMLAQGMALKAAAKALGMAPSSARHVRERIAKKLAA